MEPEFQGTSKLQPFSPRWTDPDLLEKTLVGRRELVDKLERLAIEGAGGPNKYQRLIIGPRGSGKTHVLKVLHDRLWHNEALKERLLIAYLLEDELGVASFVDFLVRLLKAISAWYPENTDLKKGLEEFYDLAPGQQQRRAVDLLLQTANTRDVLIIMENLGVTFDGKQGFGRKGQQALRDLVQQHPRFMIFASAQALVDGISESNAPFYQFFKITSLKKLSLDESLQMLATVAAAYGNSEVTKLVGTAGGRSRVRAIYEFTGGNHRLLVTFFDFLSADSVATVSDAFLEALKPLKPYYQEQMRALSAQQQKIVQYLSLERTPRTVKEIARGCLATSNTVSSQMKALLEKGFVERVPLGRESYYEVSETLFRICYEADLDHQGAPIRLFVDFLGNFYTAQELEARARGFHLLAKTISDDASSHESESKLYRAALEQYHQRKLDDDSEDVCAPGEWKDFFLDLSERQAYNEIISFARRLGDSKDSAVVLVEAQARAQQGDVAGACEALQGAIRKTPDDPALHSHLGSLLRDAGDLSTAEEHCRRALALDPASEFARRTLVTVLHETDRNKEALVELQILSELAGADSWDLSMLGIVHRELGNMIYAEDAWRKAIQIDSNSSVIRTGLGTLLASLGRLDEALREFETAAGLDDSNADAHAGAGALIAESGNLAEAEPRFRKALALDGNNLGALKGLALLLNRTGRPQDALAPLQKLVELGDNRLDLWLNFGSTYAALGDQDRTRQALRRAVELEPITEPSIAALAKSLLGQKRLVEGEALLNIAVEKWPKNAEARRLLAQILLYTGRLGDCLDQLHRAQQIEPEDEGNFVLAGLAALESGDLEVAEKELREAIRVREDKAPAWRFLGEVMTKLGRLNDAATSLETAAALAPDDSNIWTELGIAWRSAGNNDKAEDALRRAIGLNGLAAVGEIADLLVETGHAKDAEILLQQLIEKEPASIHVREALSDLFMVTDRPNEAFHQMLAVQNIEPVKAVNFLRGGLAALMAGNWAETERQLRTAIETDAKFTPAWVWLAKALSLWGRRAEAIALLGSASAAIDKAQILATLGDIQVEVGDLSAAVANYEASIELGTANAETLFGFARALLSLGRVGEGAEAALRAIDTTSSDEVFVEGLRLNLDALFSNCTRPQMVTYLDPVLDALNRKGRLSAFEQAISVAVFGLLKKHESVSKDRYEDATWAIDTIVAARVNISVLVRFLNVGIEFLKLNDAKSLMKLSREERAVFTKELGIEMDR